MISGGAGMPFSRKGSIKSVGEIDRQAGAAALVARTPGLFGDLPLLMVSGMIVGLFTGLCGQYMARRMPGGSHARRNKADMA